MKCDSLTECIAAGRRASTRLVETAGIVFVVLLVSISLWRMFGGNTVSQWEQMGLGIAEEAPLELEAGRFREVVSRRVPLDIPPTGAFRDLLDDKQITPFLAGVLPCWRGPNVGLFLHSLRLWGVNAAIHQPWEVPQSDGLILYPLKAQLQILINDDAYQWAFQRNFALRSILIEGPIGVAVITNQDAEMAAYQGQFHVGHLLQVLAEIGVPSDQPIVPRARRAIPREFTVKDILNESLWTYSSYQEPEFTANAYARWLLPPARWTTRFGETYDLDELANRLLIRPLGQGPCLGAHVPFALVPLWRANQIEPLIAEETSARIEKRLREISQHLLESQHDNGSWAHDWSEQTAPADREMLASTGMLQFSPIIATGHHLEWIAYAPEELCPPRAAVANAVEYLLSHRETLDGPIFAANMPIYCFATHVARALCAIRVADPAELYRRYQIAPRGTRPASADRVYQGHEPVGTDDVESNWLVPTE